MDGDSPSSSLELAPEELVSDFVVIDDLTRLDSSSEFLRASFSGSELSIDVLLLVVLTKQFGHKHRGLHVPNGIVDIVG